ncbi:similar to Saccharomyces cerevisiae YGL144C ROG1 Protein with putative serine active lipase domain [Maudiozyma saulgeensis]|uniref:Similar to Saccharomyces cerevisiae YGL144C ROG1 Protein with putative serine active lipase domain n=1 Tax=Maudiozyma saulgeensis TaxID=1789683 RepID=A0A1X7QZD0_9SACH|nr:similar to Saccharomyces cerevisiae YGL144C ROG1 Protein with putative serine active lipase domain [Kazachstania saulgeensis]
MSTKEDQVLYHQKSAVKVGEIERYVITYTPSQRGSKLSGSLSMMESFNKSLFLKLKNVSKSTYSANYIMGPFDLYCDVRTKDYYDTQRVVISVEKPQYESQLIPQKKFVVELMMRQLKNQYVWIVDVVSGIIFSTDNHTSYELTISFSKESLKCKVYSDVSTEWFKIQKISTSKLWKIPPQISESSKPKHLIILTHGLHSNVTTDMLYIKEEIEKQQKLFPNEELVVDGFKENVCSTEKGIKYLGIRLADYVIKLVKEYSAAKLSFIGHSLGGLIQMFAMTYISVTNPNIFQNIELSNFIALASPLLGLGAHNPKYVKYSLSHGVMGQTGKDLGLHKSKTNDNIPLLYYLSGEPTRSILKRFKRRTIYANCENDGIVPLYTSALLYLEYTQILNSLQEFKQKKHGKKKVSNASLLTSVTSLVMQPTPPSAYIDDPSIGGYPILHDKVYTMDDCQKLKEKYADTILKPYLKHKVKGKDKSYQCIIADRLQEGIDWRKVIVALPPDAHNNIIVRRRFTNAYGWCIISHLVNTHFSEEEEASKYKNDTQIDQPTETEPVELDNSWLTTSDKSSSGILSSTSNLIDRNWHRRKSALVTAADEPLEQRTSIDDD